MRPPTRDRSTQSEQGHTQRKKGVLVECLLGSCSGPDTIGGLCILWFYFSVSPPRYML